MEEQVPIQEVPAEVPDQQEEQTDQEPTKNVKNFWERLDEVFNLSKQTNQNIENILEQFPDFQRSQTMGSSALFQPDRISLCSNDDQTISSFITNLTSDTQTIPTSPQTGHFPAEYFSSFRIRLSRPLRNVKSIQLLSAVIPNATQNIPDYQTFFYYYSIRSVQDSQQGPWLVGNTYSAGDIVSYFGLNYVVNRTVTAIISQPPPFSLIYQQINLPADLTRPNYYDLNPSRIRYVYLAPTYFYPFDRVVDAINQTPEPQYFNRRYRNYQDLVDALNFCLSQGLGNNNLAGEVSFEYNPILNKIIMVCSPQAIAQDGYFMPCGYEDPNIPKFMSNPNSVITFAGGGYGNFSASAFQFVPQTYLNTRLGFTWNGKFPDPFLSSDPWSDPTTLQCLYWYLRKTDPAINIPMAQNNKITFNNYGDLVNTSCVRIYADFTFGSTQDSLGSTSSEPSQQGLLSIVPVNTTNLGVGFYQNNFNNPLGKIPQNITEVGITMLNDQGQPFYLPNSATVLLELAIEYF